MANKQKINASDRSTDRNTPLLEIKDLKKYFPMGSNSLLPGKKSLIKAVDGVSLLIRKGETLGLVGESGCGKSTLGRTIIRLYNPSGGQIFLEGNNIAQLSQSQLFPWRKKMQMIFQDPYASLNPRMTVTDIIGEGMVSHSLYTGPERQERIFELLHKVGLKRDHANRYPHEFSGGQRQRVGIARTLAVEPELIICDEPISALDVSIQAQVVNMLEDLQNEMGLTYLFIAHDLSMVKHISNHIGVMYLGQMAEMASSDELYRHPQHPYTEALLSAIPIPDPRITRQNKRIILQGEVPSPIDPPEGCRFASRCPLAVDKCRMLTPVLTDRGSNHYVACHVV